VRIGVDLGGTKIEIVAIAGHRSELIRRRIATPAGDYDAIVDALIDLVRGTEFELGEVGTVGVGTPGAIDSATRLLKNSNSTVLNGKPLQKDIETRLGREIRIANDANCLAVSESIDGAGAGAAVLFAAILGTGVGGGIAVEGRILAGRNKIAGEWGHNPLPWMTDDERPGPRCYCGKRGCIETFLSGPALADSFNAVTGVDMDPAAIAVAAECGDQQADVVLKAYEDRLARGLAHIVNVLDPEVIVLGGGLSKISRLYENVPRRMEQYVFSRPADLRLVPALHGDSSGVRTYFESSAESRLGPRATSSSFVPTGSSKKIAG
jgi:fructokinase